MKSFEEHSCDEEKPWTTVSADGVSEKIHLKEERFRMLRCELSGVPHHVHTKSWRGRKSARTLSKQQSRALQRPWPIRYQLAYLRVPSQFANTMVLLASCALLSARKVARCTSTPCTMTALMAALPPQAYLCYGK